MVTARLRTASAAVLFASPIVMLAACAPPGEVPASAPGTTPSVWTGSPAPSAVDEHGAPAEHGAEAGHETLEVPLKDAQGVEVAIARFEFASGYAKVMVETTGPGTFEPGFHGVHVHSVGKCEPDSVAPTGGAPGDFNSAGGHLQAPGHSGHPFSGDLTSLQIREDGSGLLVTTTDGFTEEDLMGEQGSAIVIHAGPDNFGNIPPEKYNQVNGTPGPDDATLATGDAGARVACGVISGE